MEQKSEFDVGRANETIKKIWELVMELPVNEGHYVLFSIQSVWIQSLVKTDLAINIVGERIIN